MKRDFKNFFAAEDFEDHTGHPKHQQDICNHANALLREAIEASPEVISSDKKNSQGTIWWALFPHWLKPAHKARLVCLEDIKNG